MYISRLTVCASLSELLSCMKIGYYKIFNNNISGCEYNVLVWKLCHLVTVYAFSAWCFHILVFYVIIIMFLEDLQ